MHSFATIEQIRDYVTAGNSTITLLSDRTDKHFTYKIKISDDKRVHFVNCLHMNDNRRYTYVGMLKYGIFQITQKSKVNADDPMFRAFEYMVKSFGGQSIPSHLTVQHSGKCGACGRKLTHPDSIDIGLGPDCALKIKGIKRGGR